MPSAAFATGILDGYYGTLKSERARKEKNALDMANFLMSTGRVRDYNDLIQHVPQFQELFNPQGGKGGKGKKGAIDPHQMIGALLDPVLKKNAAGGGQPQGQPQGSGGEGQQPLLLSEKEATERDQATAQQKRDADFEDYKRRQSVEGERELANIRAKPPTGVAPGSLGADVMAAVSEAEAKKGGPLGSEEYLKIVSDVRSKRAADTRAPEKQGTPDEYFKAKEKELGHKLSTTEMIAARRAWVDAGDTPEEKLARAKAMAEYRQTVGTPSDAAVEGESQRIALGGQDVSYVNLDSFTGEKSKNAAREKAIKAGVVPVTKQQADQLASANTALGNLTAFYDSIKSKLPADAQSRPLTQITTPLKQFFQTDEDLAAAISWKITILPQLRAMNVTGRVPVFEYQQALASQPQLTDTVGAAAKKLAIVQGTLERGARSILTRGKAEARVSAATDLNAKAKRVLQDNKRDSSDASVKAFLAIPGNKELLATMK